jgi:hypothetical protein
MTEGGTKAPWQAGFGERLLRTGLRIFSIPSGSVRWHPAWRRGGHPAIQRGYC